MEKLQDRINRVRQELENLVANGIAEAEELRLKYLSKKGVINDLLPNFVQ